MNNNYVDDQPKLRNYIEGSLMAALAAMIALIGIYIPPLQIITAFVWSVPIVVVSVRRDFRTGVLAMVVAAILLMILAPPHRAFLYLIQFAGLGIVFAYYFSKKADFAKTMMMGTVVVAISAVVAFLINFLVLGMSISDLADQFKETTETALYMYEEMGLLEGYQIEEMREMISEFPMLIARLFPGTMVVYGMMVAFITYFATRKIIQKLNLEVSELPMFRHWQIPWYFIWGIIIGLALLLLGDFMSWEPGSIMGMNVIYMFSPILFIQGLAVFAFYYYRWKIPILLKVLLLVIIVFNIPLALMILLVTGLFDPLFNYRRLGLEIKQ